MINPAMCRVFSSYYFVFWRVYRLNKSGMHQQRSAGILSSQRAKRQKITVFGCRNSVNQ